MMTGRDIVFISSIEWDFLWQVHQEIAYQFAAAGNRVLYIENTGVRAPSFQDAARIANRVMRWGRAVLSHGSREVLPNIFVTSPVVAAPFGSGVSRFVNRHLFLPAVVRTVRRMQFRDPLLWTYLPTDTALSLIKLLASPKSEVAYYCGADFSLLVTKVGSYERAEAELLRRADLVLVTCADLFEKCRMKSEQVHMAPAVINLDQFSLESETTNAPGPEAPAPTKWPRPIIGYVGGLHKLVDYRLLIGMAKARPNWAFVFVGAKTTDIDQLNELPNVYLTGQRPHAELARYIREFDVCLVPYLSDELTATVVPMKINEYLAMGKPVVSTPLPTVLDFNRRHRVLLTAANEPEQFLKAIEEALALPVDAQTLLRRREVAALGESRAFVQRISDLLEDRLKTRESRTEIIRA